MKQQQAEQHALNRILYLLEEKSMQHLSANDDKFAAVLNDIYSRVDQHANQLTA